MYSRRRTRIQFKMVPKKWCNTHFFQQEQHRWFSLDVLVKTEIKAGLSHTLSSPVPEARSATSQVLAKVASIELPQKQWPGLIGSLLSNIHQVAIHVKQAILETLGYLCDEVSADVVDQDQVNKILTAVVLCMSSSEGSDMRLAATRALYNALGFAQENFTNDTERDYIMRVVCEATLSPEVKIRQAAFECLVSISSTYYEKLAPYIQDIFNITAKAVREDEEPVALQAIEFWSLICHEEIDILEECGSDSNIPCFYFIKQALPALVPMLLETLLKQEEDQFQDEGDWNLAKAGGTCLGLVARTVGDDVLPLVIPFFEENIRKPDWRQKEAAIYAFGSIFWGPSPDKLIPIVNDALSILLTALRGDPNSHLKYTTVWILRQILVLFHCCKTTILITTTNVNQIMAMLSKSTKKDASNVVVDKACQALYFLARGYEEVGESDPLSLYFERIVYSILAVTRREDAGESRLRIGAYVVLSEMVRWSTRETVCIVLELVPKFMKRLQKTLEAPILSSNEREKQFKLQGLLCDCLHVIIDKLTVLEFNNQFMEYADEIMYLFLRIFACRNGIVHKEVMLIIGYVAAYAVGPDFAKYMPEFYKYLEMGLLEEYQVCATTVGVVADICRALGEKVLPYCDGIMTQLLRGLSSNQLHRSVKPPIFSCCGDIALAIGENFDKYLMYVMPMLQRAAELSSETLGADGEMIEYAKLLRKGILEAYYGIYDGGGFKNNSLLNPAVIDSLHLIQFVDSMDDEVWKTAIGVLGDLADTLRSNAVH